MFWPGALERLNGHARGSVEQALHVLERKEFVRRERRTSVEGESEYAFRHVLVRDVAYGQIPRATRAEKHRLAAEWIESLGRAEDRAEMLAYHYGAALELARAAGRETAALGERARLAFRDAGEHAATLNAYAAAVRYYAEAVELWPRADENRPHLLLQYGKALLAHDDPRGEDVLREAREALLECDGAEPAADAGAALGEMLWQLGRGEEARETLEQAVELLRERPPSAAKAYALSALSRVDTFLGRLEPAVERGREALEIADELDLDEVRAHALDNLGTAKVLLGDRSGIADLERSIELAVAMNSREALRAYNNLAGVLEPLGDIERARAVRAEGAAAAERLGIRSWIEAFRVREGELLDRGDWDVLEELAESDEKDVLAFMRLGRGDLERALRDSAKALAAARTSGRPDNLALALSVRHSVLDACDDPEAAAVLDELVELLPAFASWAASFPHVGITVVDAGRGDALVAALDSVPPAPAIEAQRLYAAGDAVRAADLFAEIGSPLAEAFARLRAGAQLVATGRRQEANTQLERALMFFRKAGASAYIAEAEALLAAVA